MNQSELMQTLYLVPNHGCCSNAILYLFPPNAGTNGFVEIDLWDQDDREGIIRVKPFPKWHINLGKGAPLIDVNFCPFCGIQLPLPQTYD